MNRGQCEQEEEKAVTMPSVSPISAPDFVREVREDFNSPTTSNFVNRIPQCKETVAKLEEVRHGLHARGRISGGRLRSIASFFSATFLSSSPLVRASDACYRL